VNATFKWIAENIKDDIDFVVWTGDSARHDNDEKIPRKEAEVLSTNRWIVEKFRDVWGEGGDAFSIPIVPTFGNNDILPHNILSSGPNKWLKEFSRIWSSFIPEEQTHGFERGGWFYVEVIPNKLAVFSLNTLYFFDRNAAVDGCALRSEPGYEHMEWLRIQLGFMRERGMKAILMGHVPPARTGSKQLWDETCWQKYTLWLRQYRDVVIGGLYGHMNIDHFMFQDTDEIDLVLLGDNPSALQAVRSSMDDEFTIESANDYLEELRDNWSDLPNPAAAIKDEDSSKKKKGKKSKKERALKKIGGPWGERFHTTFVSPSVVPNYFPTLRIIEYNITGLENEKVWTDVRPKSGTSQQIDRPVEEAEMYVEDYEDDVDDTETSPGVDDESVGKKKKKKKGKKHKKKPSNPDLVIPPPPSKKSPPGPAYSPQTLTMLGYKQYVANLTFINNDFTKTEVPEDDVDADKWRKGKHHGEDPKKIAKPNPFEYKIEYDTSTDPTYKLKDMTVRSYIELAHRIGQYKPVKGDQVDELRVEEFDEEVEDDSDADDDDDDDYEDNDMNGGKKKKKKKKKHRKRRRKQLKKNKVWLQFIKRAFVGTVEEDGLRAIAEAPETPVLPASEGIPTDAHDGEL
jgi:endopolyphosphatase